MAEVKNYEAPLATVAGSAVVMAFLTYFYAGLILGVDIWVSLGILFVVLSLILLIVLRFTAGSDVLNTGAQIFAFSPYAIMVLLFLTGVWG